MRNRLKDKTRENNIHQWTVQQIILTHHPHPHQHHTQHHQASSRDTEIQIIQSHNSGTARWNWIVLLTLLFFFALWFLWRYGYRIICSFMLVNQVHVFLPSIVLTESKYVLIYDLIGYWVLIILHLWQHECGLCLIGVSSYVIFLLLVRSFEVPTLPVHPSIVSNCFFFWLKYVYHLTISCLLNQHFESRV